MESNMDPLVKASNVYKGIMENDRVRVLTADFKPSDKAVMHYHPDHVVYVLKAEKGKLKITSEGKTDTLELNEGQAFFLKAQTHEAINVGSTEIINLIIELKK